MIELSPRQLKRFWSNIQKTEGCWLWTGRLRNGYGVVNQGENGRPKGRYPAHRQVYEMLVGPIADGMELDHRCHNEDPDCKGGIVNHCSHRRCVNPAHLEPVSHLENVRRHFAKLTHCRNGHKRSSENTTVRPGRTTCRRCENDRQNARRTRDKEAFRAGAKDLRAGHGTASGYSRGCRCDLCCAARREYDRNRRHVRRPDPPSADYLAAKAALHLRQETP